MRCRICFKFAVISTALWIAGCVHSANDRSAVDSHETLENGTIQVLSSGGFTAAFRILGPQFEVETGYTLDTEYGASSGGAPDSIPERLLRGEHTDIVILSVTGLGNLTEAGFVDPSSHVDLARSRIGMAVRAGADIPDIDDVDAFVQVLRDAVSIGYSASASGTYLSTVLFPQMRIWDEIQSKSERIVSERVAAVVARGDVEIGFQQISEILPIDGVSYVGPIPDELQKVTTFSAGITVNADNVEGARALIDYLSSTDKIEQIEATGLAPVAAELADK